MSGIFLDHVAIVARDLDGMQKLFGDLGLNFSAERERVAAEGVLVAFAPLPSGDSGNRSHQQGGAAEGAGRLELVAEDPDAPISARKEAFVRSLEKRGPGIHHLCFQVDDLDGLCRNLVEKGYKFTQEVPSIGAGGKRVTFIHPKSTGGVLIELSQKSVL